MLAWGLYDLGCMLSRSPPRLHARATAARFCFWTSLACAGFVILAPDAASRPMLARGARCFSTASAASALRTEALAVPLFINNKLVPSMATESIPVRCPATQDILAHTPIATASEMQAAVEAARAAFPKWSQTSVSNRARVMLKLQALIRERTDDLARLISDEHGKTLDDAKGDVFRGLEVVEYACSVPSLMMGETVPNVATDVDTHSYRVPLGVCAGIAPFNFPAMIPLWMFPLAVRRHPWTFLSAPTARAPHPRWLVRFSCRGPHPPQHPTHPTVLFWASPWVTCMEFGALRGASPIHFGPPRGITTVYFGPRRGVAPVHFGPGRGVTPVYFGPGRGVAPSPVPRWDPPTLWPALFPRRVPVQTPHVPPRVAPRSLPIGLCVKKALGVELGPRTKLEAASGTHIDARWDAPPHKLVPWRATAA